MTLFDLLDLNFIIFIFVQIWLDTYFGIKEMLIIGSPTTINKSDSATLIYLFFLEFKEKIIIFRVNFN